MIQLYTDERGYDRVVEVPDDLIDHALFRYGILLGPPDLSLLGLDEEAQKRFNNALCAARLFDYTAINGRRQEVLSIIRDTLKVSEPAARDVLRGVIAIYQQQAFGSDEEL